VQAIRGAITVDEDTPQSIEAATALVLGEILRQNRLALDQIVSVLFSMTPDLRSQFPARCARKHGWGEIPMLDFAEIDVPGALPRCIRVLLHVEFEKKRADIRHVYLRDAQALRPDLCGRAS
jgi:chorismate mutase